MNIEATIIAIGVIVFLAHLFSALFKKLRIPDVLPLICIGILIGPVTGFATIEHLGEVGPVFSSLTLALILFESGLRMKLKSLKKSIVPATLLGMLGYAASTGAVMMIAEVMLDVPRISALILGALLGGTAASVAVPLLQGLDITKDSRTALMLESVFGNVLTIVVTVALMNAYTKDAMHPLNVLGEVVFSFVAACVIGGLLAYIWCSLLERIRTLKNARSTTPAFVCIAYGLAKIFGFSGMMAALAFGIVMGNARHLPSSETYFAELRPASVSDEEHALFSEIVFLMKTFFFVYLGMSMEWLGLDILYTGAIITALLFLIRPVIVAICIRPARATTNDATIASIMIPRGLASAVLASMALGAGIPEATLLQNVAYKVIILSIAGTAIMSFLCERNMLKVPYGWIFSYFEKSTSPESREPSFKQQKDELESAQKTKKHEDLNSGSSSGSTRIRTYP